MAVVTGSYQFNAAFEELVSTGVPNPQKITAALSQIGNLANTGTTDNVDLVYFATLALAGSAQEIDLKALSYKGATLNMARIRLLMAVNAATNNTYTCTIGAAVSNPWAAILGATGTYILHPSTATNAGLWIAHAPNTTGFVTSGTSKALKFDPGANTFNVHLLIVGAVA